MSVSAIIVTRGNVDLEPIVATLPDEWELVIWENGTQVSRHPPSGDFFIDGGHVVDGFPDLSVYGRYAAIEYASHDLIYVQDDDCIVSDPQKIAHCWQANAALQRGSGASDPNDWLFANMPPEFRHDGYTDSCLVGFGACFHRDLPESAFERILGGPNPDPGGSWTNWRTTLPNGDVVGPMDAETFRRTCDVWFTTLTPRVLVDVPVERLDYAFGADRMYNQPGHVAERTRVLEMARKVRDA